MNIINLLSFSCVSLQVIHGVHIEPEHIIKKRSISQPLRILLSYDESVYRLDEDKFELINVSVKVLNNFLTDFK